MKLRVAELCASIALLLGPTASAHAYCRTSTCDSCPRDGATGCTIGGEPVAWPQACVSFSMNQAASSAVDLETATAMMREAFATWEQARCGDDGARPSIAISEAFGPAVCDVAQYNSRSGNANLIIFRDDSWPYAEPGHELAATWITVNAAGEIADADIEINATEPLSVPVGDASLELGVIANQRDLQSIMVHEAGHFLGLDHSREEGSVMQAALSVGEVRTRLSADDEAAICEVYPPDRQSERCDYTPRNGFASECRVAPSGSCSIPRGAGSGFFALGVVAMSVAALALRRRRA